MHRLTLGDFELSVFSDGTYPLDGGAFFGVVPKVMWSRKLAADDKNYVTAGLNSLLIRSEHPRTGKQTVLVETGMGNKLSDRMIKFYGQPAQLLDNLAAGGVAPEDVDIVINSHLHFDHCGWNTLRDKNGKIVPTFPRAKYYAPEGEWQYARHPSERDAISLHPRELRSAGRERADDAAQRRRGNCPGHFGADLSRTHGAHASRDYPRRCWAAQRWQKREGKGTASAVKSVPSFERARLQAAPSGRPDAEL